MDFASLKAELSKSKATLHEATKFGCKYIKQSDLEKQRQDAYLIEQEKLENQRQEKLEEKLKKISEKNHAKELEDSQNKEQDEEEGFFSIPPEEINRRLRSKGEPIIYFGETERQRIMRLKQLEAIERREGQRNELMETLKKVDAESLKRKSQETTDEKGVEKRTKLEEQKQLLEIPADQTAKISLELLKANPEETHKLIILYFKRLLREWGEELSHRPEDIQNSTQGKVALATQQQSKEYLGPLFHQLKAMSLPADVSRNIVEICSNMQERQYLKANDVYLRLSIGNAPWPIGVTMVGIHERSAREKIHSNQVAHVLNDESQRKWIQSMKRLMTFCQRKYPPSDLSRAVG